MAASRGLAEEMPRNCVSVHKTFVRSFPLTALALPASLTQNGVRAGTVLRGAMQVA
jgi:hypothetical protein